MQINNKDFIASSTFDKIKDLVSCLQVTFHHKILFANGFADY